MRKVCKRLARYLSNGEAALQTRSCAPARPSGKTGACRQAAAARLRGDYQMTAAQIAERLGLARSAVARWLTATGLGRLEALEPRPPVIRNQRERPGELLQRDIKSLGHFDEAGHRVTGQRKGNLSYGAG